MKPRDLKEEGRQGEMFQARLDQTLNLRHPLVELSRSIDWAVFEREVGPAAAGGEAGMPGLADPLAGGGLHYLKYVYCYVS